MSLFDIIKSELSEEYPIIEDSINGVIVVLSDDAREKLLDEWTNNAINSGFNVLRQERNSLLSKSDWTQMPDAPVDQAAWAEYRQVLRDLPENTKDPRYPVWPTPPV